MANIRTSEGVSLERPDGVPVTVNPDHFLWDPIYMLNGWDLDTVLLGKDGDHLIIHYRLSTTTTTTTTRIYPRF